VTPNILLVVLDALRHDAIEPHGAPAGSTPTIAQLARRGSAFPYAYAASSWTLPSHASMFTGLLPRGLGLGQAPDGPRGARPVLEQVAGRMLPRVLNESGYSTEGFSTNLWASEHAGFDLGFDRFSYTTPDRGGRINAMLGGRWRARLAWTLEGLRARSDNGAAEIGRVLRDAIGAWSGKPTFWFVNLCECHSPYLPPRPWNDLAAGGRVRAALEARRYLSFQAMCLHAAGRGEIPPAALERMRHLYARAAAYMDQWIGDVLEALDQRGILDQTLVVVTADHGENFGEHGFIGHGFAVNESLIHVPLVMAGPGAAAVADAFSLAELPRLLAQAAQLKEHPWAQRELPECVAVSQYDPIGPAGHPRVASFAERWQLDAEAVGRLTASFTSVTDGRCKLVMRNEDELLLYDLQSDPNENRPLDPRLAGDAFADLREALEHPSVTATPEAAPSTDGMTASAAELGALERQMKLLGYL
jgi:arylsulfatase A-like enzyme